MKVIRGRGTSTNASGRFEQQQIERDPEVLESVEWQEDPPVSPRTIFSRDSARSILVRNQSPDIPFDLSLNPYRGCEHGCVYCYARPTHEYLGLSAGLDFESRILVKENAPELLRKELLAGRYVPEPVNISGVTDCYQPAERRYELTRRCLEVLGDFRNPYTIITKNQLVCRDIDLLAPMARLGAAAVFVTMTSLDAELCAKLEPRTSRPAARLEAIRTLALAGIPVGVMVAPVLPAITDHELPRILAAAAEAGASRAGFVPLRLPHSVVNLFSDWLEAHFPDRKERVLNRIRSLKGGKLNDANFGSRMRGEGEFAEMLRQVFYAQCRKLGLNRESLSLSTAHFQRPGEQGSFGF